MKLANIQISTTCFNAAGARETFALNPLVLTQLLDAHHHVKTKSNTAGRHTVLTVTHLGQSFCFKFLPEQPGIEYAINLLARLIGDPHGTLMTTLIKLHQKDKPGIAVQVMPEVKGKSLDEILKNNPEKLNHISKASYTQTLLRTLLINPEDDKEDDYFLVPIPETNQYRLVRIDNERGFYAVSKANRIGRETLHVKSIVYCFDQLMQALDNATLNRFLSIDPLALLQNWLEQLDEINESHRALFTDKEIKTHFNFKDKGRESEFKTATVGPTLLGVPIVPELAKELLTRLESMQHVIKYKQKKGLPVTGLDLLKVVQPNLATYYEKALREFPTGQEEAVLNRFNAVTKGLYTVDNQQHRKSTMPSNRAISTPFRKTAIGIKEVLDTVNKTQYSPTQAAAYLNKIKNQSLDKIKEALLACDKTSTAAFQALAIRHQLQLFKELVQSAYPKIFKQRTMYSPVTSHHQHSFS